LDAWWPPWGGPWFDTLTPSKPVCISGGTYPDCAGPDFYRLRADGATGPGTKYVQLKSREGAILMKAPAGN